MELKAAPNQGRPGLPLLQAPPMPSLFPPRLAPVVLYPGPRGQSLVRLPPSVGSRVGLQVPSLAARKPYESGKAQNLFGLQVPPPCMGPIRLHSQGGLS